MPSEQVPQKSVDILPASSRDLLRICQEAEENDQDIVIAIRVFPNTDYEFKYKRPEIQYVRAKLQNIGFLTSIKTEMSDKCSKLILVVVKDKISCKQVHAEKLQDVK